MVKLRASGYNMMGRVVPFEEIEWDKHQTLTLENQGGGRKRGREERGGEGGGYYEHTHANGTHTGVYRNPNRGNGGGNGGGDERENKRRQNNNTDKHYGSKSSPTSVKQTGTSGHYGPQTVASEGEFEGQNNDDTYNNGFDMGSRKLKSRANRFRSTSPNGSGGGGSKATSEFGNYMGAGVINSKRTTKGFGEKDYERMTVVGTCEVMEKVRTWLRKHPVPDDMKAKHLPPRSQPAFLSPSFKFPKSHHFPLSPLAQTLSGLPPSNRAPKALLRPHRPHSNLLAQRPSRQNQVT